MTKNNELLTGCLTKLVEALYDISLDVQNNYRYTVYQHFKAMCTAFS